MKHIIQYITHYSTTAIAGVLLSGSFFMLLVMMNASRPESIGPAGLLIFFSLLYVFCSTFVFLLWQAFSVLLHLQVRWARQATYSAVIGLAPTILFALNTLRQLSGLDVSLVLFFTTVMVFYVSRRV